MLVLKIYLVGMLLFILYHGIKFIVDNSASWFDVILILILSVLLWPISLYIKVRKKILEKVLDRKIKKWFGKVRTRENNKTVFLRILWC